MVFNIVKCTVCVDLLTMQCMSPQPGKGPNSGLEACNPITCCYHIIDTSSLITECNKIILN